MDWSLTTGVAIRQNWYSFKFRCFTVTLEFRVQQFAQTIRQHSPIENSLFRSLDLTFHEDRITIKSQIEHEPRMLQAFYGQPTDTTNN